MIEFAIRDFDEFFPMVPFADCIFNLSQLFDELLLICVCGELKGVSQFLHLEPIRVQVIFIQMGRKLELFRQTQRGSLSFRGCPRAGSSSLRLFQKAFDFRRDALQAAPKIWSDGRYRCTAFFYAPAAFFAQRLEQLNQTFLFPIRGEDAST
jgi:hypothetical protein